MKIKLKKPLTFVKSSSIITFALQESNVNIISKNNSEKYSRGRRGAPAKGVGRATGARVQIPLSPLRTQTMFESFFNMDFSLFKTITQRVSVLNNNPPAMRVETICYTKKSPIRYNIVVQATIVRKDGDFNG